MHNEIEQIVIYRTRKLIKPEDDTIISNLDSHPNKLGQEKIAKALIKKIIKRQKKID